MLEQNVELGLSHEDVIQQLNISRETYYRYVNRIMDQDAKIWDEVYIDSAQYRATRLIQRLDECINLCREIRDSPNTKPDDRMEAANPHTVTVPSPKR